MDDTKDGGAPETVEADLTAETELAPAAELETVAEPEAIEAAAEPAEPPALERAFVLVRDMLRPHPRRTQR